MRLESRESLTVDIFGSIERFVSDVARLALHTVACGALVIAAPVLYLFFGISYCARSFDSDCTLLYVFTSPIAVSIWVLVLSRWLSARRWHQSGKGLGRWGSQWRQAHGGYGVSILKSFLYMFLGGFFSLAAQASAVVLYGVSTGRTVFSPIYSTSLIIFWSLMPLVAFSPVIIVLTHHWIRRRDRGGDWTHSTSAETIPRAVEEMDREQIARIAQQGSAAAALLGQALGDHWRERAAIYREAARTREDEERKEADAKMNIQLGTRTASPHRRANHPNRQAKGLAAPSDLPDATYYSRNQGIVTSREAI